MNKKSVLYTLLCLICGALGAAVAWRAPQTIGYIVGGLLWAYAALLGYKAKKHDRSSDWAMLGYIWSAANSMLIIFLFSFNHWFFTFMAMWQLCSAAMPITLLALKVGQEQ